ncbi:MAG TPA: M1 family metallopeptidase [Jatrophihabitans sp.]|jgi:aminopeptidase N
MSVLITAAVVAAGLLPASVASAAPSTIGSSGGGDPYFPQQGNGGYDVKHYTLELRYAPAQGYLAGTAELRAVATQTLTRFDLDLRNDMTASSVAVNGRPARHRQPAGDSHELIITPAHRLPAGRVFRVVVHYAGTPRPVTDPDGSPDGWIRTNDGAFVADEPQGSPTWFPVNNIPRDKATYSIQVTVPRGYTVASNGRFLRPVRTATHVTWRYRLTRPVSDYLATATIGRFRMFFGHTATGVPYRIFVDPQERGALVRRKLPKMIDFFSSRYGAYPFGEAGAIVDHAPKVGYALETATRPLFPGTPDELTLAHELAHQWYGDTVTCRLWRDIWVNEGFAEFSSWLWDQHRGGRTMRQHLRELLARPADSSSFEPPPGNPGKAANIFADSVYDRGAGTLEALREKVGNRIFFTIMRKWLAAHRYGNATSRGFTTFASHVAHRDLTHFFRVWLYRRAKP